MVVVVVVVVVVEISIDRNGDIQKACRNEKGIFESFV